MKINEIQNLIRFVAKSGVSEIELELKDFRISIKNPSASQEVRVVEAPAITMPQQTVQVIQTAETSTQQETVEAEKKPSGNSNEANYITIKAPMIGTFYRTSGPGKPPFVNIGDTVKTGQTLCIIEAMKLFNEIESEVSGKIVKILMDDTNPVEYDSPLFLIDPS
ncbi:MAG: acetyl-CoA carboxylase biotin carboxyl carrier protein [Flavobacteriales bacterium]|nr:acetyl-CoA carboxylase biotin carboxyl carrier protein [Flavobacteriales bacterium]